MSNGGRPSERNEPDPLEEMMKTKAGQTDMSAALLSFTILLESCEPIMDIVKGYKQKWIDSGFSTEAADQMAADFHAQVVRIMFSKVG